ncbi:hypothetical protein [Segatella bryantii]|uniref:hypothetical protein n=1 Tax=Segatella bryantii TaxID=77095 RepID=UPI00242F0800|nr:hypothetical protein [Segatella bryantii]
MKLYKREGRRFVPMQIEDRTGMFYQKDRTFARYKDENTIGVCILSTIEHDVVMSLYDSGEFNLTKDKVKSKLQKMQGITLLNEMPTTSEMFIALHKHQKSLNIDTYRKYWCKNDRFDVENIFFAVLYDHRNAHIYVASRIDVAEIRPVMRIKHF